jgi:hypothetical protein
MSPTLSQERAAQAGATPTIETVADVCGAHQPDGNPMAAWHGLGGSGGMSRIMYHGNRAGLGGGRIG